VSRAMHDTAPPAPDTVGAARIIQVIRARVGAALLYLFTRVARRFQDALVFVARRNAPHQWHAGEYRALFAAHPHPMWVYDTESLRFLEVNETAAARWGYTRDELLRMRLTDLTPSGAQPDLFVAVEHAHDHTDQPFTGQYQRKNGEVIDVEITSHSFTSPHHHAARLVIARDITERVRNERQGAAFIALGQQLSAAITEKDVARIIGVVADDLIRWDAFSLQHYVAAEDALYATLNMDIVNGQRAEVPPGAPIRTPSLMSRHTMDAGGQLLLREPPFQPHPNLQRFGDTARLSASLMFVPIRRGTTVVGVLSIQSYTPHAYTAADLATLQALADHCGGALERARAETALRASEARHRMVVDAAFDAILTIGAGGEILSFNGGAERIFGYAAHETVGQPIESLIAAGPATEPGPVARWFLAPNGRGRTHEMTGWRADGVAFPVELSVAAVPVDGETLYTAIVRDVSERKAFEARLVHQVYHDSLTGLPNRVYFAERLARALTEFATYSPVSVLLLDLDRFKVVNDSLGHEAGDRLLVSVAQRLAECVRPTDTAARLGGDEFAVLLCGTDGRGATRVAERIFAAFAASFTVGDQQLTVTASIGIAPNISEGDTPAGLVRDADVALYRAKAEGKARYAVFDARTDAHAQEQLAREQELRHALERNDLIVRYQPLVNLQTGEIAGVEALVRWPHPIWGTVPPDAFIALAEEADLIGLLDRWVLTEACRQASAWHAEHPERPPLIISVNLSARDFGEAHLVVDIARVLHETGVNPRWVQLELTESVMLAEVDSTLRTLHALKALGVRLALDDFGMGYSSLRYLLHLPVDVLKVDRSFVAGIGDNTESTAIVHTIILLAQARGLEVIAEGIETAAQAAALRALGCTFGQGYYFASPLLGADVEPIVAAGAIF